MVAQRLVLLAKEDWLNANQAASENVAGGLVEASFITRTQPSVVDEVVPRWLSGLDAQVAIKATSHIPFDPRLSKLVEESWNTDNKVLVDQKKTRAAIPFNQAIDVSLSDTVRKKYPEFLTDLKPIPR
ncbi:MAG: hypothetical protein IT307_01005 [Chloroflexi bacterium]|nr:hypothetical protein [Chloroflexota bacterium]